MFRQSNLVKPLFALGIIALLLLSSSSMFHMDMTMNSDGTMTNCPFSLGDSICTMSPLEMFSAAQGMFASLPVQNDASLILLLLSAILALAIFWKAFSPPKEPLVLRLFPNRIYIPLHSSLQELFSNGILNPKLF